MPAAPSPPLPAPVTVGLGEVLWDLFPAGPRLGGAPANFAWHAAQLGARAAVVSAVGADAQGERIRSAWNRHGIALAGLQTDPAHPTGTVRVTLRAGLPHYTCTPHVAWDFLHWNPALDGLARRTAIVCFGTLGQRAPHARAVIQRFLRTVPRTALRLFDANLRQRVFDVALLTQSLRLATWLKVSDAELRRLRPLVEGATTLPRALRPAADSAAAARRAGIAFGLLRRFRLHAVVITRGPQGSEIVTADGLLRSPAPAIRVADTVGAGDAFSAALTLAWWHNRDLAAAASFANRVGAYVASRSGATPHLPARLLRLRPAARGTGAAG